MRFCHRCGKPHDRLSDYSRCEECRAIEVEIAKTIFLRDAVDCCSTCISFTGGDYCFRFKLIVAPSQICVHYE